MLLKEHKGVLALVTLAFVWGLIAILGRYLGGYFSLFQQLYLIFGIAFVFSLFLFERTLTIHRLKQIPLRDWFIMGYRVFLGYLIGASLYREALLLTKISNVAFIQSIPFTALLGWILLKEKFTWTKLLLLLLAYIGVVTIAVKDFSSPFNIGVGELFSLISTGLFAFSFVSRKWMNNFLNDKEITQILLFLAFVVFFLASIIFEEKQFTNWTGVLLVITLFAGFLNVINIFLINYGFKNVKAVLASNILTLEALFALILAFIFYRELPTLKELFGGILIIGSVIQMNRLEENNV